MTDNLTVQILREIRDELRTTRTELSNRLDATNERLDHVRTELSDRLDHVRTELSERLHHVEGAVLELAEQQRFIVRRMKADTKRTHAGTRAQSGLGRRVEALEARVDKLER